MQKILHYRPRFFMSDASTVVFEAILTLRLRNYCFVCAFSLVFTG